MGAGGLRPACRWWSAVAREVGGLTRRLAVVVGVLVALGALVRASAPEPTSSPSGDEHLARARSFVAEVESAQRTREAKAGSAPDGAAPGSPTEPGGTSNDRRSPALHLGSPELIGLVASPRGTPLAQVRRDCPISAPLTDGHVLWMFCDSSVVAPDGTLTGFANTSAAFADQDDPATLWEPVDAGDKPYRFLTPTDLYQPCDAQHQRFLWIESAVTVPLDDGRDRVLIYYQSVCVKAGEPVDDQLFKDGGLAEYVYDPAHPPVAGQPIVGRILVEQLFPRPTDGLSPFGQAAVLHDDFVYVYRCRSNGSCSVARVGVHAAAQPGAYRYWDGVRWVADPARAIQLVDPGRSYALKPSVTYWPRAQVFLMADVLDLETGTIGVSVARNPVGPWSVPAPVTLPGCSRRHPYQCFGVEVHGDLSDRSALVFTYFNPAVGLELSPVGLARVPALALDWRETPPPSGGGGQAGMLRRDP